MATEARRDGPMAKAERDLVAMGRRACPRLGEALIALDAAWRPADRERLDWSLDELARPLLLTPRDSEARARALAGVVGSNLRPDPGPLAALHLGEVLETGRGHPLLIAAIAAELGQRAGWEVALCSTPVAWYAGMVEGDRLWLVEPTAGAAGPEPECVRRHCARELAYAVLTGLAERLPDDDAARALAIRRHVCDASPVAHPGHDPLGTRWTTPRSER